MVERRLEVVLVDRADQLLELLVGREKDLRGRHLVQVTHLEADYAVLDVVHDSNAVLCAELAGALEQVHEAEPLAVQRHRGALLELHLHVLGLVRRVLRLRDELEDVVMRRLLDVLDRPALGRAAPDVVVDRVRHGLAPALHRDAVLARVLDLLLAAHLPAAHRGDDLEPRVECNHRRLDPHLVVALAGAAVRDRVAACLARLLHGDLRDQRPSERGEERIAAAVEGIGLDRGQHVVAREFFTGIHHVALEGAEVERLAAHHVEVLAGLTQVHRERDHLGLVLVLDPLEHHARVEPAGVEQQDAPDLAGDRLV